MRMTAQELAGLTSRKTGAKVATKTVVAAPAGGKQAMQALGRKAPGVMNKTETRYAERLETLKAQGVVAWYVFEAVTLKLAHDTRLTVDFFVMLSTGELQAHDVKGSTKIIEDDAKVKMKVAAAMFPWPFFYCIPRGRTGYEWDITEVKG